MSTPSAPIIITLVVDKILSYKGVNFGTPILRVILIQQIINIREAQVENILVP